MFRDRLCYMKYMWQSPRLDVVAVRHKWVEPGVAKELRLVVKPFVFERVMGYSGFRQRRAKTTEMRCQDISP